MPTQQIAQLKLLQNNDPNYFLLGDQIKGDFNDSSIDETGYGALPVAEQNKTYMAYFDGVGGTGPEIIGQTAYLIKWIIDTEGNVANPEPGTIPLYNLIDTFESGKKAIVKLLSNDPLQTSNPNDDSLVGTHPITHVGRILPILISETGSSLGAYENTLYFNNLNTYNVENTLEYGFKAILSTNVSIPYINAEQTIIFNTEQFPNSQYDNATGIYTFASDTYTYDNRVLFRTAGKINVLFKTTANVGSQIQVVVRLYINSNIEDQLILTFTKESGVQSYDQTFFLTTGYRIFNTSDTVVIKADSFNPGANVSNVSPYIHGLNSGFEAINEYPAVPITASSPYWSIGEYTSGSNTCVLTSSLDLSNWVGLYKQSQSSNITSFGFNSNGTYDVQSGDYIRIEYNPNKVYNIKSIENTDRLYLTVAPPIPTGSRLDHFVIYRMVNDGSYVVLNVEKPVAGNGFTGIIQPEYTSQELKDNYNDIIQNLTEKNIIV